MVFIPKRNVHYIFIFVSKSEVIIMYNLFQSILRATRNKTPPGW